MKDWIRKLPHPGYGHYGGAWKHVASDYYPEPIDKMDEAFAKHDNCLSYRSKDKKVCDQKLHDRLKRIKPKNLKFKLYGTLYLWGCLLVFKP